jgi:urea transport system permease protein
MRILNAVWLLLAVMIVPLAQAATTTTAEPFSQALAGLKADEFEQKEAAVQQLAATKDPRTLAVLSALQDARLYYVIASGQFIYWDEQGSGFTATAVLTGEKLNEMDQNALAKVAVNNKLRGILKGLIAQLNVRSPDRTVRLSAINELLGETSAEKIILFRELLNEEKDEHIADLLRVAIALTDLNSTDKQIKIKAIADLSESLQPEAYNQLKKIATANSDGVYAEADLELRNAAISAVRIIDTRLEKYHLIETVFFGLSLGSILLLIAVGLAITFGVMGVINMAHGELMMIGAYTTYIVQTVFPHAIDYSLLIAIPLAFLVSGLVGVGIERGVIRFLYGRPLETLLATFGISLILQQIPRTFISAQNVTVQNPSWLSGSWVINPALSITYNRLFIFVFALLVFAGLLLILKKTRLGLQVRAVSQNRAMAKAMGIRTEWVDALTFGLGSGIAGIAGVALSQITNVGPNLGQGYIVDSFMVVVFGGVGNVWGMFVGSMSLGAVNKFLEPWTGAVLAKIFILIFIILFIQKRPRGLFPQKGRAAEG